MQHENGRLLKCWTPRFHENGPWNFQQETTRNQPASKGCPLVPKMAHKRRARQVQTDHPWRVLETHFIGGRSPVLLEVQVDSRRTEDHLVLLDVPETAIESKAPFHLETRKIGGVPFVPRTIPNTIPNCIKDKGTTHMQLCQMASLSSILTLLIEPNILPWTLFCWTLRLLVGRTVEQEVKQQM